MSAPNRLYRWMDGAHVHMAAMAHPAYDCTEYIRKDVADAKKAEAVAREREECAAIAEKEGDGPYAVKHIAAAIRARGQD
jgi:hypothetical protein